MAREAASWRPKLIGIQPMYRDARRGNQFLKLSPDEMWLASSRGSEGEGQDLLWNLQTKLKHQLIGDYIEFSSDSRLLAFQTRTINGNNRFIVEVQRVEGQTVRKFETSEEETLKGFVPQSHLVRTQSLHAERDYDLRTGNVIHVYPLSKSFWKTNSESSVRDKNDYKDLNLSPDRHQMWVSHNNVNRFDILDARTGKCLWSYSTKDADAEEFFCYPSWEDGGKTLATIENDTLLVRDSQSGKVLLRHKNNLPVPLKSWAFTKDRHTVYLLDAEGEIFRQRLR